MAELMTFNALLAFLALAALEIVLGVDNLVFIAVITGRLEAKRRPLARRIGLIVAAAGRIVLLFAIAWVITLEQTHLFALFGHPFSAKDLILVLGGVFLVGKATWEIHEAIEGAAGKHAPTEADAQTQNDSTGPAASPTAAFGAAVGQILLLDMVFSIDSVLTAIGMVKPEEYSAFWIPVTIMTAAIVVAIVVMLAFVGPLSRFIEQHPTMKMLALSFLLLIGVVLVAEGVEAHIPRGYIYFAMGFSLFVELLNLRIRRRRRAPASAATT